MIKKLSLLLLCTIFLFGENREITRIDAIEVGTKILIKNKVIVDKKISLLESSNNIIKKDISMLVDADIVNMKKLKTLLHSFKKVKEEIRLLKQTINNQKEEAKRTKKLLDDITNGIDYDFTKKHNGIKYTTKENFVNITKDTNISKNEKEKFLQKKNKQSNSHKMIVNSWKLNIRNKPNKTTSLIVNSLNAGDVVNITQCYIITDINNIDTKWCVTESGNFISRKFLEPLLVGIKSMRIITDEASMRNTPSSFEDKNIIKKLLRNTIINVYPNVLLGDWYRLVDGGFIYKGILGEVER